MLTAHKRLTVVHLILAISFMIAVTVSAQAQRGFGVRAGVSGDPTQFYIGGHYDVKEVAKRLWFRPNLEVGVGDDLTVVAINGEFVYRVPVRNSKWDAYFGGGPSGVISTLRNAPTNYKSDVGAGFNFLIGVQQPRGLMTEVKLGVGDSPTFKLGVGWCW